MRDTYSDTIKASITDHDLRMIFTKYIYTCLSVFTLLPCQIILDMEWLIFAIQFLQDLDSEMSCRLAAVSRHQGPNLDWNPQLLAFKIISIAGPPSSAC